ncbi:terminase [Subtercola boreus]|uniref:terminase n=1 Tax=Subtercola boreus TaxID=120213 RepID=UPI001C0EB05A|nr:terminase [Subtercola boreus]
MASPLLIVPEWVEQHCVIPDGDNRGNPFVLGDEQFTFVANHYMVRSDALVGQKAEAFIFRRSQLVRAQKWGKSPLIGAFVCVEGVGPVLFDGFASGREMYDCRDFGCGCGWAYEYDQGEPMGRPWSTPLIQITATSEDQTDNTYDALRPMIELGPLAEIIRHTGEEFIRLPGGGRIDVVTSKANSRLGQRVTFAPQDETGLWVKSNGGHKLASTQRRGLAGMGGRAIETTNAWDPAQDSVAQRTFEAPSKDINKDFRQPPAHLSFGDKRDRHKMFVFNYAGAPWVSVAAIEAEAAELVQKDKAEAERFFGNRIVAGSGAWLDFARWESKKATHVVPDKTPIVLGFDGSDVDDWTGIGHVPLSGGVSQHRAGQLF